MIWYLARKYVVLVLAILMAPLPTIFGTSLGVFLERPSRRSGDAGLPGWPTSPRRR